MRTRVYGRRGQPRPEDCVHDLHGAVQSTPIVTAIAILSLTLGIGAKCGVGSIRRGCCQPRGQISIF